MEPENTALAMVVVLVVGPIASGALAAAAAVTHGHPGVAKLVFIIGAVVTVLAMSEMADRFKEAAEDIGEDFPESFRE